MSAEDAAIVRRIRARCPDNRFEGGSDDELIQLFRSGSARRVGGGSAVAAHPLVVQPVPAALMVRVLGPHPVEGQQSETMVKFFLPLTTPLSTSAPRCLSVSRLSPIRVRLFLFMFLILPEADLAPCQLSAATVVPDRTPAIAAISTQLHAALVHRRYTGGTPNALLATDLRPSRARFKQEIVEPPHEDRRLAIDVAAEVSAIALDVHHQDWISKLSCWQR
jgi:hypothetical protein